MTNPITIMTQKNGAPIDSCVKVSWFSNHRILKSGLHLSCRPSSVNNNTNLAGKKYHHLPKSETLFIGRAPMHHFTQLFLRFEVASFLMILSAQNWLSTWCVWCDFNCFFPSSFTKKNPSQVLLTKFLRHHTHVFTVQASKKAPHLRRPTWHEPAVCSHPTYPRWSVNACWHSVKSKYPNVWNIHLLKRHSWFPAKRSSRFSDDIQPLFTVSDIFKQKAHFRSLVTTFTIYKQFNLLLKCKLAIQSVSTSWCNLRSKQCAKVNPGPHKLHDPRKPNGFQGPKLFYTPR